MDLGKQELFYEKAYFLLHPSKGGVCVSLSARLFQSSGWFAFGFPAGPPTGAMVADPIEQSSFKTDIMTGLFGFNPFVTQNFFPLCQKFLIETGAVKKLSSLRLFVRRNRTTGRFV